MELVEQFIEEKTYKDIVKEINKVLNERKGIAIRISKKIEVEIIREALEKEGILQEDCEYAESIYRGENTVIEPYYMDHDEIDLYYDIVNEYCYDYGKEYKNYKVDIRKRKLIEISEEKFWEIK